jgi:hypothetical protein
MIDEQAPLRGTEGSRGRVDEDSARILARDDRQPPARDHLLDIAPRRVQSSRQAMEGIGRCGTIDDRSGVVAPQTSVGQRRSTLVGMVTLLRLDELAVVRSLKHGLPRRTQAGRRGRPAGAGRAFHAPEMDGHGPPAIVGSDDEFRSPRRQIVDACGVEGRPCSIQPVVHREITAMAIHANPVGTPIGRRIHLVPSQQQYELVAGILVWDEALVPIDVPLGPRRR